MKLSKFALLAAVATGLCSSALAGNAADPAYYGGVVPASHLSSCDCGEPVCGCEVGCDLGCADPACGCESGNVCCDNGCDSLCGGGFGLGDCCLGDPFELFGEHCGWNIGGWIQLGYHTEDAQANAAAASSRFNSRDSEVQLQQSWLYIEKVADGSCGLGLGGRIDYVYGTDGPDTQAFGDDDIDNAWDTDWDHGADYGQAIPQAYVEMAYGDTSIKVGHFYTIIGWEVVPATGNFFYSHAYTMYNAEPFTHTGALVTTQLTNDVSVWGGYTLGWDSGFNDNGDLYLGGTSVDLNDDVTMIYATTIGRFGENNDGPNHERGYMHSLIFDVALSDNLQYIFQNDYLKTKQENGFYFRDALAVNQYLIYTINDCWAAGARFEWFNVDSAARPGGYGDNNDIYDLTFGLNYRPHANLLVRPEVRWDWDKDQNGLFDGTPINENADSTQTTFGVDAILTF